MIRLLPLLTLGLVLTLRPVHSQTDGAPTVEPLTLEEAHAFALRHAPSLELQRLSYSNLVESVEIARATYDPVFRVRRSWRDEDDPRRTTGSVTQTLPADLEAQFSARHQEASGGDLTNYAFTLSKTVLGGGSRLEGRIHLERALIREAREANNLSREQRRMFLTVTQRYYNVVRNQLTLRLRQLQIDRAKRNLEHARVKEDPLDIATARLGVPESELEVLRTERSIADGLLELRDEIGMPLAQPLAVNTQLVYEVRRPDLDRDLPLALERHENILNAQLELRLNRMERRVANTKRLPEVRLELTAEQTESAFEDDSEVRGDVVLEWPWLDRRDRAEARQRELDVAQSEVRLFEAVRDVEKEIKSLGLRLAEAERTVELQAERVEVLERQLRLFQDRWENGEINILEFIRSQNDLENARVRLVAQQTRYLELLAEYDFAAGR